MQSCFLATHPKITAFHNKILLSVVTLYNLFGIASLIAFTDLILFLGFGKSIVKLEAEGYLTLFL
jgi:hypothetical protein